MKENPFDNSAFEHKAFLQRKENIFPFGSSPVRIFGVWSRGILDNYQEDFRLQHLTAFREQAAELGGDYMRDGYDAIEIRQHSLDVHLPGVTEAEHLTALRRLFGLEPIEPGSVLLDPTESQALRDLLHNLSDLMVQLSADGVTVHASEISLYQTLITDLWRRLQQPTDKTRQMELNHASPH